MRPAWARGGEPLPSPRGPVQCPPGPRPTLSHVQSGTGRASHHLAVVRGVEQHPWVGHGLAAWRNDAQEAVVVTILSHQSCQVLGALQMLSQESCHPGQFQVVHSKSCTPNAGPSTCPLPQGTECFLHPLTRESLCLTKEHHCLPESGTLWLADSSPPTPELNSPTWGGLQ